MALSDAGNVLAVAEPSFGLGGYSDTWSLGRVRVYVATNNTGVAFSTTDYVVAIFDGEGRVSSLLILEFGDLPDRKTKVIQFDLLETSCDGISRIVVNDLAGCVSNNEDSKLCLSNLITSSRTSIDFGL